MAEAVVNASVALNISNVLAEAVSNNAAGVASNAVDIADNKVMM